jgi:hypothetical protein
MPRHQLHLHHLYLHRHHQASITSLHEHAVIPQCGPVCVSVCRCVTGAMSQELVRWGIHSDDVHVVHDYAASFFKRATLCQTHELFLRLRPALARPPGSDAAISAAYSSSASADSAGEAVERSSDFVTEWLADANNENGSLVTEADARQTRGRQARWRADRPAIIVSSTSWYERSSAYRYCQRRREGKDDSRAQLYSR